MLVLIARLGRSASALGLAYCYPMVLSMAPVAFLAQFWAVVLAFVG